MIATYNQEDEAAIRELLVGRRIISAEIGDFTDPHGHGYVSEKSGRLVLDDGTKLYLVGHEGGCSCGAGDYFLSKVAVVPNAITNVWFDNSPGDEDSGRGSYRIYVFTELGPSNVAEFVGSDGNGYYGTGYTITVVPE